jgi:23S rRNA (cytidine1920-2'-O)/16S rRNA (cytidine1409-2'-O)-methyltransferase
VTESKKRLDLYLVEKGLALSRTHAQELIQAGQVFLIEKNQRKGLKKSSIAVEESAVIEVEKGPANRFVSRGGLKLEGALEKANLTVQGLSVLDVGISTGGFTDCLLQKGAAFVLGVDVGHGQVHSTLLQDSRLQVLEGINARNLSRDEQVLAKMPAEKFDLAVMDVSFI